MIKTVLTPWGQAEVIMEGKVGGTPKAYMTRKRYEELVLRIEHMLPKSLVKEEK